MVSALRIVPSCRLRAYVLTLVTIGSSVGLTGCSDVELRKATQTFDQAMLSSKSAIRDYYLNINVVERNNYFEEARFNPKVLLSTSQITADGAIKSPLVTVVEPEYIEARLKVLEMLANYSHGLALLAASDAPSKVKEQILAIGANVKQIEADVSDLAQKPSTQIGAYTGFVTTIGGIAMENILDLKKDGAIRAYVEQGQEAAGDAFKILGDDLNDLNLKYKRDAKAKLARYVSFYNKRFRTNVEPAPTTFIVDPVRTSFLNQTQNAAIELAAISNGSPARLVAAMKAAHEKLIAAANGKASSESVTARVLQDYSEVLTDAQEVASAVQLLKKNIGTGAAK